MHADLTAAVDAFDRVIAAADGLVDRQVLDPVARTVRSVRDRAGYLGDTLVAAVAGGTGSGKSSLINALAGEVVTESGGMRPTTGTPVAWIPANPEPGLIRLLDDLGVSERVGQDAYPWLALIDLPDTDSVVVDHRHTVEALLPRVDLVLWVVDPEKYQDRVLHDRYLKPLAAYHRQFVFVLNQTDRLGDGMAESLVEDLAANLEGEGILQPVIVATAADPDVGPPMGVADLISTLEETIDVKQTVYAKLATDLSAAAAALAASPDLTGGVGFGERWERVREEAAGLLAGGDRQGAVARLSGFVDDLADEVGGGAAAALRRRLTSGVIERAADVAWEASGAHRPPPSPPLPRAATWARWLAAGAVMVGMVWAADRLRVGASLLVPVVVVLLAGAAWYGLGAWSARWRSDRHRASLVEHEAALRRPMARHLDTQLGRELREVLRLRAGVTAAATELNLALAELDRRLAG